MIFSIELRNWSICVSQFYAIVSLPVSIEHIPPNGFIEKTVEGKA